MTNNDIKRIREMMEFLTKRELSKELKKLKPTEKKIYDLTGIKGQTEIVKILNIAPNTVSNAWKKLEKEGILIKEGQKYKKVV